MEQARRPDPEEEALRGLLERVRACRACAGALPRGCRPVLRVRASARVLIVGQAPGTKVHETGIPWNDPSGDRLRKWLDLDRDRFYDESRIAIIPMGLCYPGRHPRGGDLPPRAECAALWFPALLEHLPNVELTLLAGAYAQQHYLGGKAKKNLTETVRAWREYRPAYIPTPHPSFRNNRWLRDNAWFEEDLAPYLRRRVHALIG